MSWPVSHARAKRVDVYSANGPGGRIWGTGRQDRGSLFRGSAKVDTGGLQRLQPECEWFLAPDFELLVSRGSKGLALSPDDNAWREAADGCMWIGPDGLVVELRTGREFEAPLRSASVLTLGAASMSFDLGLSLDSIGWLVQEQRNFDSFLKGAPLYFAVHDVVVGPSDG